MSEREAEKVASGAACDARGCGDAACAGGDCVRNAIVRLLVVAVALAGVAWATGQAAWLPVSALLVVSAAALWGLDRWSLRRARAPETGEAKCPR